MFDASSRDASSGLDALNDDLDLHLNDDHAATTARESNENMILSPKFIKHSSSHGSFFDMIDAPSSGVGVSGGDVDDEEKKPSRWPRQQQNPALWRSSWIRRSSHDDTIISSSGPKEQQQRQRANSFVETMKSIPRTLSRPRLAVQVQDNGERDDDDDDDDNDDVRETKDEADHTDGQHQQPQQRPQHRWAQRQPRQQAPQFHQQQQQCKEEGGGDNNENMAVPQVVLFVDNGDKDLRCSDITCDAKALRLQLQLLVGDVDFNTDGDGDGIGVDKTVMSDIDEQQCTENDAKDGSGISRCKEKNGKSREQCSGKSNDSRKNGTANHNERLLGERTSQIDEQLQDSHQLKQQQQQQMSNLEESEHWTPSEFAFSSVGSASLEKQ